MRNRRTTNLDETRRGAHRARMKRPTVMSFLPLEQHLSSIKESMRGEIK